MCPLCNSSCAYILQDKYRQGQWHSCTGCGFNGDLITLASKCLQLSILATIHRLQSYGICSSEHNALDSAQALIAENADLETNRLLLAKAGQNALQPPSNLTPALQALRVNPKYLAASADQSRWLGGPIDPDDSDISTKAKRIFLLPAYDMPGRIAGWLHFGNYGKGSDVWSAKYHPLLSDGGLYYHPAIRNSLHGQDRAVLAISDCAMVYRTVLRGLLASPNPLPIVGYAGAHNDDAWEVFQDCKRVVWSPKPTTEQIARAVLCNGWVSQSYPQDVYDRMAKDTPAENYRTFVRSAIPWQRALNQFAETKSDSEIETLLREVISRGVRLEVIEQALVPGQRERCRKILGVKTYSCIEVGRAKLIEIDEQLYLRGKSGKLLLISEVIPKIDKVVAFKEDVFPTLSLGSLRYKKRDIPTVMPFAELRARYRDRIHEACARAGLALPHIDERYCRLYDFALQLSPPGVCKGISNEGWDDPSQSLAIGKYCISKTQTVALGYDLPGKDPNSVYLPFPRIVMPHEFVELTKATPANQLLWKCFTFVAANVLAQVAGELPINAIMHGEVPCSVDILTKLNCIRFPRLKDKLQCHRWPGIFGSKASRIYDVEHVVDELNGSVGIAIQTNKQFLLSDFVHLGVKTKHRPKSKDMNKLQELLPCYLENAIRRGVEFKHTGPWLQRVVNDVQEWVRIETHGKLEPPI